MRRASLVVVVLVSSCAPKRAGEEHPADPPERGAGVLRDVGASVEPSAPAAAEVPIEQEAAAEAELWTRRMQQFDAARSDTEWARKAYPILAPEMTKAARDLGGDVEHFECRGKSCRAHLRWPDSQHRGHRLMNVRFSYNCATSSHQAHDTDTSTFLFDCDLEEGKHSFEAE